MLKKNCLDLKVRHGLHSICQKNVNEVFRTRPFANLNPRIPLFNILSRGRHFLDTSSTAAHFQMLVLSLISYFNMYYRELIALCDLVYVFVSKDTPVWVTIKDDLK